MMSIIDVSSATEYNWRTNYSDEINADCHSFLKPGKNLDLKLFKKMKIIPLFWNISL